MTIEEYFGEWGRVIDFSLTEQIMNTLVKKKSILCPSIKDVFKAFSLCPYSNLKLVIIGNEPYCSINNNHPIATGIAFANSKDTPKDKLSPYLDILIDSIIDFTTYQNIVIFDTSLEKIANQGVLFLNATLTCEVNKHAVHTMLWKPFTESLLKNLSLYNNGIVYLLLGNNAKSFKHCIDTKANYVFSGNYPAWYIRNHKRMSSQVWRDINEVIEKNFNTKIQWYENV